jgi:AhpD family alkylhydroperoxidase
MIKYIPAIAAPAAQGLAGQIYTQIIREFGLGEPLMLHALLPELLAGVWMAFRESFLAGGVSRSAKEAVAATVSRLNQCPYCVEAHTMILSAAGEQEIADAISQGRDDHIPNPQVRALVQWAAATRSPDALIVQHPPFSPQEAPEIIGTAVFFHYINRMVSVLLDKTLTFPNNHWSSETLQQFVHWRFARTMRQSYPAGNSVPFLPEAALPADLAWAETIPAIAAAFARFAAVVERVGAEVLSPVVRECVHAQIQTWKGEDLGLSRHWVKQALNGLDAAAQAAGQLTLLTALAPYQIDETVIERFRTYYFGGEKLLGALAWGSFTAARRIGTWLYIS